MQHNETKPQHETSHRKIKTNAMFQPVVSPLVFVRADPRIIFQMHIVYRCSPIGVALLLVVVVFVFVFVCLCCVCFRLFVCLVFACLPIVLAWPTISIGREIQHMSCGCCVSPLLSSRSGGCRWVQIRPQVRGQRWGNGVTKIGKISYKDYKTTNGYNQQRLPTDDYNQQ